MAKNTPRDYTQRGACIIYRSTKYTDVFVFDADLFERGLKEYNETVEEKISGPPFLRTQVWVGPNIDLLGDAFVPVAYVKLKRGSVELKLGADGYVIECDGTCFDARAVKEGLAAGTAGKVTLLPPNDS